MMIGAMFISHERTEAAYTTMASYLRKHCPERKSLKAFGTDGDLALVNGMKSIFPEAQHLLCDLHMRDNIESELSKSKAPKLICTEIVRDIFGSRNGIEKKCLEYNTRSTFCND